MLNARHEVKTLGELPGLAVSLAPVLITERQVGMAIAAQALCVPLNVAYGGWDHGWSPRQQG
jgi:hypothetical protein